MDGSGVHRTTTRPTPSIRRVFVVLPEPTSWVDPLLAELPNELDVQAFAPWVLPNAVVKLAGRVGFVRRRRGGALGATTGTLWFTAAELVARTAARGRISKTLRHRVSMRAAVDRLAAFQLSRCDEPPLVIAPSLAARHTFAAARQRGCPCLLVEDLPDFDSLVDGLDSLAAQHPQDAFLRNHRPRFAARARQRSERCLADAIAVRGHVAWHRLGTVRPRVGLPHAQTQHEHHDGPDIAFAGPLVARNGAMYLPRLLEALPGRTIRVLATGDGASALRHPRLRVDSSLDGVGVVLSLGTLESHPPTVTRALSRGIRVVGTQASTGMLDPQSIIDVDPDDTVATAHAIERALCGAAPRPRAWSPPQTLSGWVRDRITTR